MKTLIDLDKLSDADRRTVLASGLLDIKLDDVWRMTSEQSRRLGAIGKACALPNEPRQRATSRRAAYRANEPGRKRIESEKRVEIARSTNKYHAKPTVYNGVRYDSKAEARYAGMLDDSKAAGGPVWEWWRQVKIPLGPDFSTRVDFLVAEIYTSQHIAGPLVTFHAVEVKGKETREFVKVRKLWPKYVRYPLHIVKGINVEIINPASAGG